MQSTKCNVLCGLLLPHNGYINIIGFLIKRVRFEKNSYKLFDIVDSLEKKNTRVKLHALKMFRFQPF